MTEKIPREGDVVQALVLHRPDGDGIEAVDERFRVSQQDRGVGGAQDLTTVGGAQYATMSALA